MALIERNALQAATALSTGALARETVQSQSEQDRHWFRQNIPCRTACPAGTDIPGYLEAVYHGRYDEAYRINLGDNVFPGVLGRVCARPCEDACRHGRAGNGEPVAICFSKRSAADHMAASPVVLPLLFPASGRHVAVVGGGVAGLSAARDLRRLGHEVTVYERHERPGGMLNQGIPAFRLPRALIDREVGQITALGVQVRCGVEIGRDVTLDELATRHDAVVLAAGTLRPNMPAVPGTNARGGEHGLHFLFDVNERGRRGIGARVAVIGGGYTAMDCARTASRLGAQVTVYYRRGREDMVVLPGELEEYLAEGGRLENHLSPVEVLGNSDAVTGLRLIRTEPVVAEGQSRRGFRDVPGSEIDVAVDQVIWATGQYPQTDWIHGPLAGALVGRDGWLASGSRAQTSLRNVFAAGDFALGATSLIQAIGHARDCARAVDLFLTGAVRQREVLRLEPVFQSGREGRGTGRSSAMNAIPLHPMPLVPVPARARNGSGDGLLAGSRPGSGVALLPLSLQVRDHRQPLRSLRRVPQGQARCRVHPGDLRAGAR
ncbi:MAG: FAD-dependent oxidoreductase [Betaproteobacteria bacterium]|nr:FAD-dependent oxidoreductase [Betaproteobacteria bacterium]